MSGVNSINKKGLAICLGLLLLTAGSGGREVRMPYGSLDSNPEFSFGEASESARMPLFAEDLCAAAADLTENSTIDPGTVKAACVYDISDKTVLYSYNANERLAPASLTKVMTALLVLENCENLDEIITVGDVTIREEGAQLFNLKEGDKISIRNLLYITLVYSGNDAALALAQYIGGSTEGFVEMMNERAKSLGATHTSFKNPHGLTQDEHYTCAYDLYLMFQEAAKHPEFLEIIQTVNTTIAYTGADGGAVEKAISTTNQYLRGGYDVPSGLSIVGGKTGSTSAAGKCIIFYARSGAGHDLIAVVMGAGDFDGLYNTASELCEDTVLQ